MKGLTQKQQELLDFVEAFGRREKKAPTVYEIADYFDIKPATVFTHIRTLQRKRYINFTSELGNITSLRKRTSVQSSLTICIPLVKKILPGTLILEEDNFENTIQYDPALLPHGTDDHQLFGLRITDNSMSGVGMKDGDIIIAKHTETASIGDLVVALVEEKTLVIRSFHIQERQVELRQTGSQYESQYYAPEEVQVHGVVVALYRNISG